MAHLTISAAWYFASSSGLEIQGSRPSVFNFSATSGSLKMRWISPLIFRAMSRGVFAGANTANHVVASKPGTVSATVGISGALDERFAVVTAIARILPSRAIGSADGMVSNINWICPPTRSGIANCRPL